MNVNQCILIVDNIESLQKEVDAIKNSSVDKKGLSDKEKQLKDKKNDFEKNGCSQDLFLLNCARLDYKMTVIRAIIQNANGQGDFSKAETYNAYLKGLQAEYDQKKCEPRMNQFRNEGLVNTIDKYSSMDAQRIEAESKLAVKQRLLIGGAILTVGFVMIMFIGKKKK